MRALSEMVRSLGAAEIARALSTYKYLRLLTLLPALWLLASIVAVALVRGEFLDSISDYYGGPLRDVFVGGLMASGLALVAYKGESNVEDYALNFAGFNAFLVALVPNSFADQVAHAREVPVGSGVVSGLELIQNLRIGLVVFLLVAAAFVIADLALMKWSAFRWGDQTALGNWLIRLSWATEVVLLVFVVAIAAGFEKVGCVSLFSVVHFYAAVLLVVNLSFAAASYAWPVRLRKPDEQNPDASPRAHLAFRVITVAMWVGIAVGGVCIALGVPYAVLVTEVYELGLFVLFWFGATRDEWSRFETAG